MIKKLAIYAVLIVLTGLYSCKDPDYIDKYERPDWLVGKIYTQILDQPELSTFAECIELTGFDTIINISGSYTAFAPSDEAFDTWLLQNQYNSVSDIPIEELTDLVSYHIIQNPWSKLQLRTLDVYGWIDSLDVNNNEPRGYKRETLLLEENRQYSVRVEKDQMLILNDENTNWKRRTVTDSRKYAPLFYSEYFDIYNLSSSDYEFFFKRPFSGGDDIYYANGKIISDEIAAENGFVYIIDQVVDPLLTAYEIMDRDDSQNDYSKFLDLVNNFPLFEYNEEKTKNQPGAELGLVVDSLFDMSYPELAFDINNEKTQPPSGTFGLPENVTLRYNHGIVAPTNEAFDKLVNDYINIPNGWGNFDAVPLNIKRIIANSHMSVNSIYPTDLELGFYNGESDLVQVDEATVVQKEYGSNCSFIGVDAPIVPNAFSSVTGPVYLQPGFSRCMYAIEQAGLLAALKRANKDYMLFVMTDLKLRDDSSLVYDIDKEQFSVFQLSPQGDVNYTLNKNDLRTLLLNHVAVANPRGLAKKEFIPNMAGNYIIIDNETGIVSGTAKTTEGYQGLENKPNRLTELNANPNNGKTYLIDNWFSFTATNMYNRIQFTYPEFYDLLDRAGLVNKSEYRLNFISESEVYTVFIPSTDALSAFDFDALTTEELQNLLMLHFVQGDIIFTDGNKNEGYYETARVDEKSTQFTKVFTKIYIKPGIDLIEIRAAGGGVYTEIPESASANILTGVKIESEENQVFSNIFNNGVIHLVDKVLVVDDLDRD